MEYFLLLLEDKQRRFGDDRSGWAAAASAIVPRFSISKEGIFEILKV